MIHILFLLNNLASEQFFSPGDIWPCLNKILNVGVGMLLASVGLRPEMLQCSGQPVQQSDLPFHFNV